MGMLKITPLTFDILRNPNEDLSGTSISDCSQKKKKEEERKSLDRKKKGKV